MIYFDPRGMGGSGDVEVDDDMGLDAVRQDFDGLRRYLGLDRVHAIGWSNGAMNLILLAAEYPDTLRSATFVHGVAHFAEEDLRAWAERQPDLFEKMGALQTEMNEGRMTWVEQTERLRALWVEEFFPASCADPLAAEQVLKDLYEGVEFSGRHADYANREAPVFDARDRLGLVTAPCLVVAGAHDNFPPAKVRELHEGLGNSTFVIFESSGHFSPIEEPEAFQTAVLGFWGKW